MNRICLIGRLTKDTELRATPNGVYTTSNSLAVKRSFKNDKGEYESDFINIIAWRNTAEYICKYATKGSLVGVEGKLQTRTFDNKEGQKVYVTEVVVENVDLLDTRKKESETQENTQPITEEPEFNDPFAEYGETVQIDDRFLD